MTIINSHSSKQSKCPCRESKHLGLEAAQLLPILVSLSSKEEACTKTDSPLDMWSWARLTQHLLRVFPVSAQVVLTIWFKDFLTLLF